MKHHSIRASLLLLLSCALFCCQGSQPQQRPESRPRIPAGLFDNLGDHHRKITTSSPMAQRFFDQGLVFTFAFNHGAAVRSFREAARFDPECPMAWWGVALASGPHINKPEPSPDEAEVAYDAVQRALGLSGNGSQTERQLIGALGRRYSDPPPKNRSELDRAYADAMRAVWAAHPDDADVGALFAEAMMDLRPWDLWTHDGRMQPGTQEILATLEAVLALAPRHPGANHFYIHAIEASPEPERGLATADRLRDLVPGAGHLVHMPAHIYIRVGRYADAATANERAIAADREYVARAGRGGFYEIYRAHNYHFLAYASMMEGRSAQALRSAREMVAEMPPEFIKDTKDLVDGFLALPLHVLVRFGMWEDLLREPAPAPELQVSTSFWHYARGVAFAATGRVAEAQAEGLALDQAFASVGECAVVGLNPAKKVLEIARRMLAGEIAFRQGALEKCFAELRAAITLEEALAYDEPPDWMEPVRHALGALLLHAGRVEEAEAVYREDLKRNPENGWSLFGLTQCLVARNADSRELEARFRTAWARADIVPHASCFCRPKP